MGNPRGYGPGAGAEAGPSRNSDSERRFKMITHICRSEMRLWALMWKRYRKSTHDKDLAVFALRMALHFRAYDAAAKGGAR